MDAIFFRCTDIFEAVVECMIVACTELRKFYHCKGNIWEVCYHDIDKFPYTLSVTQNHILLKDSLDMRVWVTFCAQDFL